MNRKIHMWKLISLMKFPFHIWNWNYLPMKYYFRIWNCMWNFRRGWPARVKKLLPLFFIVVVVVVVVVIINIILVIVEFIVIIIANVLLLLFSSWVFLSTKRNCIIKTINGRVIVCLQLLCIKLCSFVILCCKGSPEASYYRSAKIPVNDAESSDRRRTGVLETEELWTESTVSSSQTWGGRILQKWSWKKYRCCVFG